VSGKAGTRRLGFRQTASGTRPTRTRRAIFHEASLAVSGEALALKENVRRFPLAITEQHDFCAIRLPAEPLDMIEQGCAVPAALFALFDHHIFQEREWLPCMHRIQAESQERGSNNMPASFQDPKKVVRVRADFGQSLFQNVYMLVWSNRTDQLPIKSIDGGCVLAMRLTHNDIFFDVVHAGKILF
jgi:hypothetical protein